jgi:hypothetical protein
MTLAALSRVQRFVLVCLSGLSFFVVLAPGRASAASDDEKHARALYERAEKSFDVGKFSDALADYQAAYEAKPLPGFLFNIAQCYRNMGDFERARFFFRRYLAVDPRAPNRRKVEELISEMTKQLEAQQKDQKAAGATAPPTPTSSSVGTSAPPAASPPAVEETPAASPPAVIPPPAPAPPLTPEVEASPGIGPPIVTTTPAAPEKKPLSHRWWFWTGLGAVVVGGAVAAFFLTRPETRTPGTLDPIDGSR